VALHYRALADVARDRLEDPGRAAAYMEQASALAPDDREISALVDLYNEAGRQRDAVPILERIIASFGTRRAKELASGSTASAARSRRWATRRGAGAVRRGLQDRPDERADPARPRAPVPEDGRPRARAEDLPRAAPAAPRRVGRASPRPTCTSTSARRSPAGRQAKAIGMLERALEPTRATRAQRSCSRSSRVVDAR
jgi:hypothetical protein